MTPRFTRLLEAHAAASLEKQIALGEHVAPAKGQGFRYEFGSGTLSFGHSFSFKMQVLGTESEVSNTWLWAWANVESRIPEELLRAASALRSFGVKQQIRELSEPEIPVGKPGDGAFCGYVAAMAACGACKGQAFYRCPYEGGAVFVMIHEGLPARPLPPSRIPGIFQQLVCTFPINNRRAFSSYLRYHGLTEQVQGRQVSASTPDGWWVQAEFDEYGRLTSLKAPVEPNTSTAGIKSQGPSVRHRPRPKYR